MKRAMRRDKYVAMVRYFAMVRRVCREVERGGSWPDDVYTEVPHGRIGVDALLRSGKWSWWLAEKCASLHLGDVPMDRFEVKTLAHNPLLLPRMIEGPVRKRMGGWRGWTGEEEE